jgi:hypothetical protein
VTAVLGIAAPAPAAPAPSTLSAATQAPAWTPKVHGWAGLEEALTPAQTAAVLGPVCGSPLIVRRTKDGRFETWNYDHGGDLLFVNGALTYWTVPETERAAVAAVQSTSHLAAEKSAPAETSPKSGA